MDELRQLPIPLLVWYRENARVLPWRSDPTPYHVWVSEIMLQQTRVAAVLDYYRRFLEAAPDVAPLAALSQDRLMKLWQGLGYYSRARNMQKAAVQIVEDYGGVFPNTYEAIRGLAGVGDSRFQLYVRVLLPQSQYRFRKIEVAAPGHAADEIPHSTFIGGVHCGVQLPFQGRAAGVPLAAAPGQTLRPVAGKAASALSFVHQHRAPLFDGVLWYYRTNFLICKEGGVAVPRGNLA